MSLPQTPAPAGLLWFGFAAAFLLAAASLSPGPAVAQVASQSVNMVSGIQWPGGDPFLQRQNEPSVAVSSRNQRHLLAGANDYRAVDLPFSTPNAPETGDAWLGVFKSFDGGITWRSTLLPGYPQQVPRTGPLSTFSTAADPVVRAGTNGLFYYSGIAFNRDTKDGVVFVARFMDLNNKENGNPTLDADPIRYIDTKVVDSAAPSAPFIDKPWIAVDKPRLLDGVCHLTVPQPLPGNPAATVQQTVPAGSVYAAWTEATGSGSSLTTNVFFSSSRDCGTTWSQPVKLNGTNKVNQGATIAIDPATGVIYVVWRRFASGSQTDAIMMTRSFRGLLFPTPFVVVSLPAYSAAHPTDPSFFDQGTTGDSFRTNAYPTIAIDRRPDAGTEDDDEPDTPTFRGKVFVAWSQRGIGPGGDARVVLSVSTNGGSSWSAATPIDNASLVDDSGNSFSRGHQFMPQMTVTADKITAIYYDARFDHTFGLFSPRSNPLTPDPVSGKLYLETRELKGELLTPGGTAGVNMVFTPFFVETGMTQWRHTLDLRVAQADAAVSPVFSSSRLSQYSFGTRGDEYGTITALQQLQINPPNLKLFQQGSVPFIGDYIDVAGQTFLPPKPPGRRWRFNSLPGSSPVFLASWTSNQDVVPPLDGDWTHYTPAASTGGTSVFNSNLQRPPCVSGQEGMRNQNIYAARISQGLAVTSVQNAKPLSSTLQRDLTLSVENLTSLERTFRLTIAGQPARGRASFVPAPNPLPSPLPAATMTLDVIIPANSSVARSVYALSSDPHALIEVDVAEVNGAPGGPLKTNGLTGFVVFNTDPSAPTLIDPDNTSGPSVTTVEIYNPNVSNPNVSNPNVSNPNVSNPNVSNPNVSNPNVSNPNVSNPNVSNADLANPNVSNPNVSNPNVSNPNVSNPNVSNPNVSNAPVSDATYTVTNTGNTAATYRVELVGTAPAGTPLQLIITKPYANPASQNCVLFEQQHNVPIANVVNPEVVIPGSPPASGITDSSDGNATFVLGPGESILVTIRAPVEVLTLTNIIQNLAPVVVAHAPNTNDLTNKPAASPPVITTSGLPDGVANQPYSAPMTALGGTPPYTAWAATGLPSGLGINVSTGLISGTPTAAGTFAVGVSVTDSASKTGNRVYILDVASVSAPASLTFFVQPGNATGGQTMSSVAVLALDGTVSPVPAASITIAPGTFPCSAATLSGPTTALTDPTGIATFTGLSIDRGGWGYTLTASVTGNPVVNVSSNAFNVEGFCDTGSMAIGRAQMPATLLNDGRVLVTGGATGLATVTASAELFDPAGDSGVGSFNSTASMTAARTLHQATLLKDGRVLVTGGNDGSGSVGAFSTAELYEPTGNDYTGSFVPTGSMGTARSSHSAAPLPDGRVLVCGGANAGGILSSAEVFDPSGNGGMGAFTPTGNLSTARAEPMATPLLDGRVLVSGGVTAAGAFVANAEIYDPTTGTFSATGSMSDARGYHTATLLSDGKVLIAGGRNSTGYLASAEIFDPAGNGGLGIFSSTGTLAAARGYHASTVLTDGKVLISGGTNIGGFLDSSELFDPTAATFLPAGTMSAARRSHGATLLPDGRVLIAGGVGSGGTLLSGAELFYPFPPTEFLVTNTSDSGAGSLRQAILDANAHPGMDAIHFNIPGAGIQVISPASALPTITDPVQLDATTQPGYAGTPLIRIDGAGLGGLDWGFQLNASNSVLRGFAITRFFASWGVAVYNASGSRVQSNYVGTDGASALGNRAGIGLMACSGCLVEGNTVSGNTFGGIGLESGTIESIVRDNRVGTDSSGTVAIPNGGIGVGLEHVATQYNLITHNLVSGNGGSAIVLTETHHNTISGNKLGTDSLGLTPLPNHFIALSITSNAHDNTIGGSTPGAGNLIAFTLGSGVGIDASPNNQIAGNTITNNSGGGVWVQNAASSGTTIGASIPGGGNVITLNTGWGLLLNGVSGTAVKGNRIGTDAAGTTAMGNSGAGVTITGAASANTIGGPSAADGNVISANGNDGITVETGTTGTTISNNFIGTNAAGSAAIPNTGYGVSLSTSSGDTVSDNVIAGSSSTGIGLNGATSSTIRHNWIGTNAALAPGLGNLQGGISVWGSTGTIIGGTGPTDANVVAYNHQTGIAVYGSTGAQIIGNLVSGNTGNGIVAYGGTQNATIAGNRIGVNSAGTAAFGNTNSGIIVDGATTTGIMIGGAGSGAGNVISGNAGTGIQLSAGVSGVGIVRNLIGTNAAGNAAIGNAWGVYLMGTDTALNTISQNVVSGNTANGLDFRNGAHDNVVTGNLIGSDLTGTLRIPNAGDGVLITDGANTNSIGGTGAGAGNIFVGNNAGIVLGNTHDNLIQGNWVGTNPALASGLGGTYGVYLNTNNSLVGGMAVGAANTIANNAVGVEVYSGSGNTILSNSIFGNQLSGISLSSGTNGSVTPPVIASAVDDGSRTLASGTVTLPTPIPGITLYLQFFSNPTCEHPPFGEGRTLLGTFTVVTDGAGVGTFSLTLPTGLLGQVVTATTSTAAGAGGNSSGFSACRSVSGP